MNGGEVGSPDLCHAVLAKAGFADSTVEVDQSGGRFVPMEIVERAWDGWVANPTFHPRDPGAVSKLLDLREEYLAEARSLATDQGVWDEMAAYFVVGRKG